MLQQLHRTENPDTTSSIKVEWITRVGDVEKIADEWKSFESETRDRTVFSTYDFLITWYRNYSVADKPLIGIAREGTSLVGIAPLILRRGRLGKIPLTRVQFAMHDAHSGEFLTTDDRPEITGAFIDSLAATVPFDVICLNGIDPGSARYMEVQSAATRSGLKMALSNHEHAIVDLTNGYDHYYGLMSRNFRRTVKRQDERVQKAGLPQVDVVRIASPDDRLESSINRLFAVTESSYKLTGQRLADCHRNFLGDLARHFSKRGMLHLSVLSVGSKDAAVVMGLVERGCYYDLTLAYAEEFAELSPGAYLIQQVLKDLASHGVHTLLSHGAHEYKRRWSTSFIPSTRVFLFSGSARSLASHFVRFRMGTVWNWLGAEAP